MEGKALTDVPAWSSTIRFIKREGKREVRRNTIEREWRKRKRHCRAND